MKELLVKIGLLSVFMAFTLSACFDENSLNNNGKEEEKNENMAYFSFYFDTGSSLGGRSSTPETKGTPKERQVNSVHLVLYGTSEKSEYVFNLQARSNGSDAFHGDDVSSAVDPVESHFIMKAKQVKEQDYKALVLVNAPSYILEAVSVGKSLDEFREGITTVYSAGSPVELVGADGDNFFISNFKDLINVSSKCLGINAEEAEYDPVDILVDRAVAKVDLKTNRLTVPHGDISQLYWKTDIINRTTYWIRRWALTKDKKEETALHRDRSILYAEDTNFRNFRGTSGYLDVFHYITKDLINKSPNDDYEYVTENTMAEDEQYEDVTTRIVIKVNYIPEGLSTGESYYVYRRNIITEAAMARYVADPSSIPDDYEGLNAAIQVARNSTESADIGNNPAVSFSVVGINYYKYGINYYAIPIRHFDDELVSKAGGYGRYGVVRNNYYCINLLSISGPGSVDIPEPEGPDDKEEGYLSTDIQVQDWYIHDHEVEEV